MIIAVSHYGTDKPLPDLMEVGLWNALALGTTEAAHLTGRTVASALRIDCNEARLSILSNEFYASDETLLLALNFSTDFEHERPWEPISSNSREDMVRMAACGEEHN